MPARRFLLDDMPGAHLPSAMVAAFRRQIAYELNVGALRAGRLDGARGPSLTATPRDFRPCDPPLGRAMLGGRFVLGGAMIDVGSGGDPWDRISPSRRFAISLHRFDWAPHLLACGEAGASEALRLFLEWRRLFYQPNRFVWGGQVLERRLFNLTCSARRMAAVASDAEAGVLFNALLHQARYLSGLADGPVRLAERLTVVATAVAALNGRSVERLAARTLSRLAQALPDAVLPDGGLKSRSPEAGLELLLDLLTLDDVLLQRGRETPTAVARAIDRLGAAARFFTLGDGRLGAFQGGEAADPQRVRAALNQDDDDAARPLGAAPHSGYHRLVGRAIQVLVDAGPPAEGPWSVAACAQPLALEVTCGSDRIFSNCGWSPDAASVGAASPELLRLTPGGSTAELGGRSVGRLLGGFPGEILGPRLIGGARTVDGARNENDAGAWVALSHDGWAARFGVTHERRLFVDGRMDELRGEDLFSGDQGGRIPRPVPLAIRFHAAADVQVSIALDGRSVLLRGPSNRGWWFRNDAPEVVLEPSIQFQNGLPRRSVQVVLRGLIDAGGPTRVRWKLTPVEASAPKPAGPRLRAAEPIPASLILEAEVDPVASEDADGDAAADADADADADGARFA
jgi:uncharacterized heparinase superfamily protein